MSLCGIERKRQAFDGILQIGFQQFLYFCKRAEGHGAQMMHNAFRIACIQCNDLPVLRGYRQ
jgi:hypothetical protein